MRVLLLIGFAIASHCVSAAIYDVTNSSVLQLGRGFDPGRPDTQMNFCTDPAAYVVEPEKPVVVFFKGETMLHRSTRTLDKAEGRDWSLEVKVAYGPARANVSKQTSEKDSLSIESDDLSWEFQSRAVFQNQTWRPKSPPGVLAANVLKWPSKDVFAKCGSELVTSITNFATARVIFTAHSVNSATRQSLVDSFTAEASVNAVVDGSVKASQTFTSFTNQTAKDARVTVAVLLNGEPSELGNFVVTGDGKDLENIQRAVKTFLDGFIVNPTVVDPKAPPKRIEEMSVDERKSRTRMGVPGSYTTGDITAYMPSAGNARPPSSLVGMFAQDNYYDARDARARQIKINTVLSDYGNGGYGWLAPQDVAQLNEASKRIDAYLLKVDDAMKDCVGASVSKCKRVGPFLERIAIRGSPNTNCRDWNSSQQCTRCVIPFKWDLAPPQATQTQFACWPMPSGQATARFTGRFPMQLQQGEPYTDAWFLARLYPAAYPPAQFEDRYTAISYASVPDINVMKSPSSKAAQVDDRGVSRWTLDLWYCFNQYKGKGTEPKAFRSCSSENSFVEIISTN